LIKIKINIIKMNMLRRNIRLSQDCESKNRNKRH